jgi:hypothetical protein
MGKTQQNQSSEMAQQNYNRATGGYDQLQNYLWSNLGPAQDQSKTAYAGASGAYSSSLGSTGAMDPDTYANQSKTNQTNMGTGGYDPAALSNLRGNISANTKTGGYDQSTIDKLDASYGGLTAGGLGGLDPAQTATIRGGYGSLASTGGISNETADAMRRQSASGVQSIYSTLGQKLARSQTAQGFGGGGGETAQMARQAAEEQSKATTGVDAQIGQLRQQGTIAGLGGLSNFEQGTAAGQRAAVAGQQQLGASIASGRLASTGQEADVAGRQAAGTLQASGAQQDLETGAAMQKLQAAGGLSALYSSSPGYVNSMVQQILQSQATTGTLTAEQAQIMAELGKEPGLLKQITDGIGSVAGIGASVGKMLVP